MKKITILLLLLLATRRVDCQDLHPIATITGFKGQVAVDAIGNVYSFKGFEVFKYDSNGHQVAKFSTHHYGMITGIDVTDPFKILVVFGPFHWVLILDNNLVESSGFSLDFIDFPGTELICTAKGEGFWIFDRVQRRPVKLNSRLETVLTGSPVSVILDSIGLPMSLSSAGDWLVLNGKLGSVVFDRYGTYFRNYKNENGVPAKSFGNRLFFKESSGVKIVDIRTSEIHDFPIKAGVESEEIYPCSAGIWFRSGDNLNLLPY